MRRSHFELPSPDSNTRSNVERCRYQIRTKRLGRGRLVTIQAGVKNRTVLLEWEAALAAQISVNKVFNFLQAFRVESQIKGIMCLFRL